MRHAHIGEKVTINIILFFLVIIIFFQDLKISNDIQYFAFPSSNKVTEVDDNYFNIVKGEWSRNDDRES